MYGKTATMLLLVFAIVVALTFTIPDPDKVALINNALVLVLTIYMVFVILPAYTGMFEDEPLGDLIHRAVFSLGVIGLVLVTVKVMSGTEDGADLIPANILIAASVAYLGICVIKYVIALRKRRMAKDAEAVA
jgi:EamA domain-containing membrane protein RarD